MEMYGTYDLQPTCRIQDIGNAANMFEDFGQFVGFTSVN